MIFVTGANGFVGSRFVAQLLAHGIAVRGLIRAGKTPLLQHPLLSWHVGDIDNRASLELCMEGVETVVHLAAILSQADEAINQRINAEGTRTLVQLCRVQGVTRFVLMSAAAATFTRTNAYGRSKRKAEEIVLNSELDSVVMRIPLVLGQGSEEWVRFVDYVRMLPGIIPVFGPGTAIKRPLYIDDVLAALLAITQQSVLGNRIWEVACRETVTLDGLIDATCHRLGLRKTKLHVPLWLSLFMAGCAEKLLGAKSPITRDIIRGMNEDVRFDTEPAYRELGLSPRSLADAINASV